MVNIAKPDRFEFEILKNRKHKHSRKKKSKEGEFKQYSNLDANQVL